MKLKLIVNNSSELSYDQICSKILSHEIVYDCMINNDITADFPLFESKLNYHKNLQSQFEMNSFNQDQFNNSESLTKIFKFFSNKKYAIMDRFEVSEPKHPITGEMIRIEAGWHGNEENLLPINFFIAQGVKDGQKGCYSSLNQHHIDLICLAIDAAQTSETLQEEVLDTKFENVIDKSSLFLKLQSQNQTNETPKLSESNNIVTFQNFKNTMLKVIPEVG